MNTDIIDENEAVRAENISKFFDSMSGERVYALKNVSFACRKGEITGIVGPNGAGKTTFLRIVSSMIKPSSGRIMIFGKEMVQDEAVMRIGFLSGESALYERLTGLENILFASDLCGMPRAKAMERIERLSELLSFNGIEKKLCKGLSTGEKQKIAIARSIIHDPEIVILDEATSGLDILSSRHILSLAVSLKNSGRAVLYSAHNMGEIERIADRVAFINSGCVAEFGSIKDILEKYGTSDLSECFLKVTGNECEKHSINLS